MSTATAEVGGEKLSLTYSTPCTSNFLRPWTNMFSALKSRQVGGGKKKSVQTTPLTMKNPPQHIWLWWNQYQDKTEKESIQQHFKHN